MSMDMSGVEFNKGAGGRRQGSFERGETGFIAGFERKVLFRIARWVAFSICFLLFVVMVAGVVYLATSMSGTDKPDPAQVVQELRPSSPEAAAQPRRAEGSALVQQSSLVGLRISPEVQELLSHANNRQVFENWLSEFDRSDRQSFMDGLAEAIREARKFGVDDADALNAYYQYYQEYVSERALRQMASIQEKLYLAASVVSVLLLVALFTLVLVLLAIERNTYRTANVVQQS